MRGKSIARHHLACTAILLLAGCHSLQPAAEARLSVFDTYVEALAARYPYFAQKHVDWRGLAHAYRAAVVAAGRPSQFYHLLTALLAELDDPHVSLSIPAKCWGDADGAAASLADVPGLHLGTLDRWLHAFAWPDGQAPTPPAQLPADVRDYPEITRIDGVRVIFPLYENLLLGPPGSTVELQLRWADGTRMRHTLRRPAQARPHTVRVLVNGEWIDVEIATRRTLEDVASLRAVDRWSLLQLKTLECEGIDGGEDRVVEHFDALLAQAAGSDGLILDLRGDHGGRFSLLARLLGRFLSHRVEMVQEVPTESRMLGLLSVHYFGRIFYDPRPPLWEKPLVVLTSWDTGSAAEWLARLLQRDAGAIVIGEQTIGAEAAVERVQGTDGTTLAFGSQRLFEVTGVGIQDQGVTPDVAVRLRLDDLRRCGSLPAAQADFEQRVLDEAQRQLQRLAAASAK